MARWGGRWVSYLGSGLLLPQQEEEGHLLEQCRGLDKAVVYLTKFVRQNQVSLNRVLMAEQRARWVSTSGQWATQSLAQLTTD